MEEQLEQLEQFKILKLEINKRIRKEIDFKKVKEIINLLEVEILDQKFTTDAPTLLWYCCYKGYGYDLVSLLINKGCNENITNTDGETILLTSIKWGKSALVEKISNDFRDMIFISDNNRNTSLMFAVKEPEPNIEILKCLIEKIPTEKKTDFFYSCNNQGKTVLMVAAETTKFKKQTTILKIIIDNIPKKKRAEFLNLPDKEGNTALM